MKEILIFQSAFKHYSSTEKRLSNIHQETKKRQVETIMIIIHLQKKRAKNMMVLFKSKK